MNQLDDDAVGVTDGRHRDRAERTGLLDPPRVLPEADAAEPAEGGVDVAHTQRGVVQRA